MKKIKNKSYRAIDNLCDEDKAKICDNCFKSDRCKHAYSHFFANHTCIEVWLKVKDELETEQETMEEYLSES